MTLLCGQEEQELSQDCGEQLIEPEEAREKNGPFPTNSL